MWVVIIVSCVPAVRPLCVKGAKNVSTFSTTAGTSSSIQLSNFQTDKARTQTTDTAMNSNEFSTLHTDADGTQTTNTAGNSNENFIRHKTHGSGDTMVPGAMAMEMEIT